MKRTLALILSLVMCLGLLAGCGDKKTDDGQTDGKTLVVGTQNFDGKFSPFFYTNSYENDVMSMIFDGLLLTDREGSVVLKGADGEVTGDNSVSGEHVKLNGKDLCSMNMWGFRPEYLQQLEQGFRDFFRKEVPENPLKSEFLIPIHVGNLLEADDISVKVLPTDDTWYGMTYKEDVPEVRKSFAKLIQGGIYTEELFDDLA